MQTWEPIVPTKLGDTSGDYLRWKHSVLAVRDLPEYKLRKLWKLNFSAKDIENDKHWTVFPPSQAMRQRVKPGMAIGEKRGRAVSERGRQRAYAKALLAEAQRLLDFHRLDDAMLERVRADRDGFIRLVQSLSGKG